MINKNIFLFLLMCWFILLMGMMIGAARSHQFPPAPLGTEADPNIYSWADRDGDGDVDLVDYSHFAKEYTGSIGSGPQMGFSPNEKWQMEIEIQLLRQANAKLDNELRLEQGRNTVEINQYQQQLGSMLLSKFEGMIQNVRQPINVYLYDVSSVGGIHITFDDPNGVR